MLTLLLFKVSLISRLFSVYTVTGPTQAPAILPRVVGRDSWSLHSVSPVVLDDFLEAESVAITL